MSDRMFPADTRGERIGIMGGTFDPIHTGHLIIAERAREEAGLHKILFLPTGMSYLKEGRDVADRMDRLRMTGIAVQDNPDFYVSSIEVDRPGKTFTADTLRELDDLYPGNEWFLIVGADAFLMMDSWVRPQEIFSAAHILCAVRGDADIKALQDKAAYLGEHFGASCSLIPIGRFDISSSEIRDRIRDNKSVRYFLNDEVIRYIREHGLYRRDAGSMGDF